MVTTVFNWFLFVLFSEKPVNLGLVFQVSEWGKVQAYKLVSVFSSSNGNTLIIKAMEDKFKNQSPLFYLELYKLSMIIWVLSCWGKKKRSSKTFWKRFQKLLHYNKLPHHRMVWDIIGGSDSDTNPYPNRKPAYSDQNVER